MTLEGDRIAEHGATTVLQQLKTTIEAIDANELSIEDQNLIQRGNRVASYVEHYLDQVDPVLTPMGRLDALEKNLQAANQQFGNFRSNGNRNHLTNAQASLDSALQVTQQIPRIDTPADVEGLRKSIADYRKSAGQYVRYLTDEAQELREHIKQLEQDVAAQEAEVQTQKGRLDQAIQSFVDSTAETREKHSQQVTDLVEAAKKQLATTTDDIGNRLVTEVEKLEGENTAALGKIKAQAQGRLDELSEQRDRAAEIVGMIARTGMAGGYQEEADSEKKQADLWRWIAVVSMAGIVGTAIWIVFSTQDQDVGTTQLLAKIFASLAFGILAAFAGREAGRHRRREQRNRRLQLELSSIDGYLETLPEENRNAIKGALADRLFGHPDPVHDTSEDDLRPASLMDLVKLFLPGPSS